ncbi:Hsp20/alpha crystallin family protein [Adhaeribacter radiodurans]|uniref:Hsp20/alpha crystallin family protein n=1 Tax=Adhaeribacter radiodurans TaxID=2745197 RepID=A0A7L7LE68_9BACT|nr:Hsp20/alpha crystallin family protein [Adhaeribacter radiodurans]QMU30825.1 Hsp20/alpha crystallin family protein [Adhaeribacter radiodurans]
MKPTLFNNQITLPWISDPLDYLIDRPIENLPGSSPYLPDNNFRQTPDSYILEVAVPGMSRKQLKLEVENQVLTIRGKKKHKTNSGWFTKKTTYRSTHFYKTYVLPDDADTDSIWAKCTSGLLKITIPKVKSKSTKKIIPVNGTTEPVRNKWQKVRGSLKI